MVLPVRPKHGIEASTARLKLKTLSATESAITIIGEIKLQVVVAVIIVIRIKIHIVLHSFNTKSSARTL